jgi:peptidoglycan glycosyltransferase
MNTPLRRVGMAMLAMLVLLLGNITYIQLVRADDYRTDSRNQRVLLDEYARQRGQIIANGDGRELLAKVTPTNDRLKYQRQYPKGAAFATVTGYYSTRFGSNGLEKAEDEILNGSDDRLFVRRLSDLITGRDPRGGNIQATVIPQVQQAAYDAMTAAGYTGAVVALKPQTGEILALVSTPSYDPNPLASHDKDEQQKAWDQVRDANNAKKPVLDRAIQENYPPGSTFKLVVAAAALEDGKDENYLLPADASITLPGTNTDLENFSHTHCGPDAGAAQVTMAVALQFSCNTAFATLADQLGKQKLEDKAEAFGIGQKDLQIPLGVVASSIGKLPDRASLFQTGIGQRDVLLTPMQDAMIVAGIANGGDVMQPQLVERILAPDLQVISDFDAKKLSSAMTSSEATKLRDMMKLSEDHTKGDGKVPGLVIASKTGTAEHGVDPKATPPHAWYVAFAPADNPQIAVAVVVENGGNRGLAATGSSVAAGVGRAAINALPGIGGR